MGLRRVKEYNGLALVQDPKEAEFDEMPRHSIATGLVDFITPVAEMPGRIMAYRDQIASAPVGTEKPDSDDNQALIDIFANLRVRTGHDFANYKRATVQRRIERRMAVCDLRSLPEYSQYMRENPEEADSLFEPARDKVYRHPTFYAIPDEVKNL